ESRPPPASSLPPPATPSAPRRSSASPYRPAYRKRGQPPLESAASRSGESSEGKGKCLRRGLFSGGDQILLSPIDHHAPETTVLLRHISCELPCNPESVRATSMSATGTLVIP